METSESQHSFRSVVIAGNWKMYKTIEEATHFVETLAPLIGKSQAAVFLAVPFTAIHPTVQYVKKLGISIKIGAQNMNDASEGAFTGEVAGKMLLEAGAEFVILGHSERRHIFHESNSFINRKIKRALSDKLQPILCVGETEKEHDSGEMEHVLKSQLLECLEGIKEEDVGKIIFAYEPVWAIGSGKTARPEDAQKAHQFCRSVIAQTWSQDLANSLIIQYGGSVKPENASELLEQQDVDGLLVGGASLSAESFAQIINSWRGG